MTIAKNYLLEKTFAREGGLFERDIFSKRHMLEKPFARLTFSRTDIFSKKNDITVFEDFDFCGRQNVIVWSSMFKTGG